MPAPDPLWIIFVFETVIYKSKGPKGYTRFKPLPYFNAQKEHHIVYARKFRGNREQALVVSEKCKQDMFNIFTSNMASNSYRITDYVIAMLNTASDTSETIFSVIPDRYNIPGMLYTRNKEPVILSNQLLAKWGIFWEYEK